MFEKNNEQHYLDVYDWNLDVTKLVKICVAVACCAKERILTQLLLIVILGVSVLIFIPFYINFILIPDTTIKITVGRDESNRVWGESN